MNKHKEDAEEETADAADSGGGGGGRAVVLLVRLVPLLQRPGLGRRRGLRRPRGGPWGAFGGVPWAPRRSRETGREHLSWEVRKRC